MAPKAPVVRQHVVLGHPDADCLLTKMMVRKFIRDHLKFRGELSARLMPQGTEYRRPDGKVIRPSPEGYYTVVDGVAYWFVDCGGPDSKLDHHDGRDPSAAAKFDRLTGYMFTRGEFAEWGEVVKLATLADTGELKDRWATLPAIISGLRHRPYEDLIDLVSLWVEGMLANARPKVAARKVKVDVVDQIEVSDVKSTSIQVEVLPNGRRIALIVGPEDMGSPLRHRAATKGQVAVALSVVSDKGHLGILACGMRDLRDVPNLIPQVRLGEAQLRGMVLDPNSAGDIQMVANWFAHLVTPTREGQDPFVPHLLNGSKMAPIMSDAERSVIPIAALIRLIRLCVGAMPPVTGAVETTISDEVVDQVA